MPGYLLNSGSTVQCSHLGLARPVGFNPRVKVSGQPIVTRMNTYTITLCPFKPPCITTAPWITSATRVRASGIPVLLQDSLANCLPTATPLRIVFTQPRVRGM